MLFYAAGSALNSQDYDLALNYFNKLFWNLILSQI